MPLYKDWIIWLAAIAVFAAISGSVVESYQRPVLAGPFGIPTGETEFSIEGFQEFAFLIDAVIAFIFQFSPVTAAGWPTVLVDGSDLPRFPN